MFAIKLTSHAQHIGNNFNVNKSLKQKLVATKAYTIMASVSKFTSSCSEYCCAFPAGCVVDQGSASIPPVVTIEALQNTTVEQDDTIIINCAALNVGNSTTIWWALNGSLLESSDKVLFITGNYNNVSCRASSQIVITNFTTEDEGVYSCFVNRSGVSYHSDNKSFYLDPTMMSKIINIANIPFIL